MDSHRATLFLAYGTAVAGWLIARRVFPEVWPRSAPSTRPHPWRDLGLTVVALVGVLGVGQLYARGVRFDAQGGLGVVAECANQLLIFSPLLAVLAFQRVKPAEVWIRVDRLPIRLAVAAILALVALLVFSLVRTDAPAYFELLGFIYHPNNLGIAVQVLLEDLTIAILFVRFVAVVRHPYWVVIAVALLFAAGHVPAMLAGGASALELLPLVADFALVTLVLTAAWRAADLWWLFSVHFALDTSQFFR